MGALFPGARVSLAMIGSPARVDSLMASGESSRDAPSVRVWPGRQCACNTECRTPLSGRDSARPGSLPVRAVISAASRSMMSPSLSVVQTVPSCRRKLAPALSSPPKQHEPSNNPGTNHLKPTGTSQRRRPRLSHDPIDHAAAHQRLTNHGVRRPRRPMREQIADGHRQVVIGVQQPAEGVTMPCRSASGSLANATRNLSFSPTSRAIAYGLEQSMRITPS